MSAACLMQAVGVYTYYFDVVSANAVVQYQLKLHQGTKNQKKTPITLLLQLQIFFHSGVFQPLFKNQLSGCIIVSNSGYVLVIVVKGFVNHCFVTVIRVFIMQLHIVNIEDLFIKADGRIINLGKGKVCCERVNTIMIWLPE